MRHIEVEDRDVAVGTIWKVKKYPRSRYSYVVTSTHEGHNDDGMSCIVVAYECVEHTPFHTQMEIDMFLRQFVEVG